MKIIITEQQYNNTIDKYITFKLEPHEERFPKENRKIIYWIKDGKKIACVDKKRDYFYITYGIFNSISMMFSLEYNETEKVIKNWLKEHYEMGGLTVMYLV